MRIGIDLGGTKTEIIALADDGEVLRRQRAETPAGDYQGTIDTIVPITQAEKLARKLEVNNVPFIFAPFKGGYHGYDFFEDANPGVMYLIEEFLAEYLAR